MTIVSKYGLIFLLCCLVLFCQGQTSDKTIRLQVLNKAIVDSLYVFGKWTVNGRTETHLKYLGQIRTKHGHTFKIVNSSWFWGLSHRATSRILVFNERNQYVGEYYVATSDLPTEMEGGKLIFRNTDESCDPKVATIINLNNGLPKRFFRECKDGLGDIYSFGSD
jgi:hypothetical protein